MTTTKPTPEEALAMARECGIYAAIHDPIVTLSEQGVCKLVTLAYQRGVDDDRKSVGVRTYGDGTQATGTQPLPPYSPKEQEILYLALDLAQKAWDGNCEYAEIEGLAWNLRNDLRALLKAAGMPLPSVRHNAEITGLSG